MYHRYKFPICLRYADFDLMLTIQTVELNISQVKTFLRIQKAEHI